MKRQRSFTEIHHIVEDLLCRLVFRTAPLNNLGLRSNLWWWTHSYDVERDENGERINTMEAKMIFSLANFFLEHVNVPKDNLFIGSPIIQQRNYLHRQGKGIRVHASGGFTTEIEELEKFDLCIISLAIPCDLNLRKETITSWLCDILSASWKAVVIVSHHSWISEEKLNWSELNVVVQKMQDVSLQHSPVGPLLASLHANNCSLIYHKLPLCCPRHPKYRFIADANQVEGGVILERPCPFPCMSPFEACPSERHLCLEHCHVHRKKSKCPYPCQRILPCAPHKCLMLCSQPCDCFHFSATPLHCSHRMILSGSQKEENIKSKKVTHYYIGSTCCSLQKSWKCTEQIPVPCLYCEAVILIPCPGEDFNNLQTELVCRECYTLHGHYRHEIRFKKTEKLNQMVMHVDNAFLEQDRQQYEMAQQGTFLMNQVIVVTQPQLCIATNVALAEWTEINPAWMCAELNDFSLQNSPGIIRSRALLVLNTPRPLPVLALLVQLLHHDKLVAIDALGVRLCMTIVEPQVQRMYFSVLQELEADNTQDLFADYEIKEEVASPENFFPYSGYVSHPSAMTLSEGRLVLITLTKESYDEQESRGKTQNSHSEEINEITSRAVTKYDSSLDPHYVLFGRLREIPTSDHETLTAKSCSVEILHAKIDAQPRGINESEFQHIISRVLVSKLRVTLQPHAPVRIVSLVGRITTGSESPQTLEKILFVLKQRKWTISTAKAQIGDRGNLLEIFSFNATRCKSYSPIEYVLEREKRILYSSSSSYMPPDYPLYVVLQHGSGTVDLDIQIPVLLLPLRSVVFDLHEHMRRRLMERKNVDFMVSSQVDREFFKETEKRRVRGRKTKKNITDPCELEGDTSLLVRRVEDRKRKEIAPHRLLLGTMENRRRMWEEQVKELEARFTEEHHETPHMPQS